MFAKIPLEVFGDDRLSKTDLRVLGVLFTHADTNGKCWPTRDRISEMTGLHISKVSDATKRLVDYGWLKKEGVGGQSKPNVYIINQSNTIAKHATVAESATVAELATVATLEHTVAESATRTVAEVATRYYKDEPTIEPTNEQTTSCSEPKNLDSKPEAKKVTVFSPTIFEILLNDGSSYQVTQSEVDQNSTLYPGIDILQEYRKMQGWAIANQARRKTKRGIKAFINSWLSRAQDSVGQHSRASPQGQQRSSYKPLVQRQQEALAGVKTTGLGLFEIVGIPGEPKIINPLGEVINGN